VRAGKQPDARAEARIEWAVAEQEDENDQHSYEQHQGTQETEQRWSAATQLMAQIDAASEQPSERCEQQKRLLP
jgi:hypothetical protein|tara:strand:+ start:1763 stop:1984 length:222 start_codon:yes stop_codon:yes gene_type:complete